MFKWWLICSFQIFHYIWFCWFILFLILSVCVCACSHMLTYAPPCAHVCLHVGMYMWVQVPVETRKQYGSPEAWVRAGWEPPNVAAANWTGILWKMSRDPSHWLVLFSCELDRRKKIFREDEAQWPEHWDSQITAQLPALPLLMRGVMKDKHFSFEPLRI